MDKNTVFLIIFSIGFIGFVFAVIRGWKNKDGKKK